MGNAPAAAHKPPERRHPWRRAALGLVGLALLLGALALAIRLSDVGGGLGTASGQPGGAANQANLGAGQQVGVAGGQITLAGGTATPTDGVVAAAPPATPIGQGDRAILLAQPAAITAAPGLPFAASFTLQNSGASTWSAAGGYGLVCDRARHPTASCPEGMWIGFGPYVIAPGQRVTFTVDLIAPITPGSYLLWWNLAHAGHIFGSPDVALRVVVLLPPQPTATPTLTPSATPATTPSVTPSTTPSATPSVTPEPSPSVSPTASPAASPTASPSAVPSPPATPIPTPLTTLPPLG